MKSTTNILITGANGQLGHEMRNALAGDSRFNATLTDVAGEGVEPLDITNAAAVRNMVRNRQIDVIVNCAAYTAVDAAEDNEQLARTLNADAVANLANAAHECGARMVQISTDYVFDGQACIPYLESHATNPQSVYGSTKLEGEHRLLDIMPEDSVILRTAWLYSPYGKNFVKTMISLGRSKPELRVVFDQVGSPTCARDLAAAIMTVLTAPQWHAGVYHYTNEGVTSWYDFTLAIHRLAGITGCNVQPCHSNEFPARAHRPSYSVLDKSKFKETFSVTIPHWEVSLREQVQQIIENETTCH